MSILRPGILHRGVLHAQILLPGVFYLGFLRPEVLRLGVVNQEMKKFFFFFFFSYKKKKKKVNQGILLPVLLPPGFFRQVVLYLEVFDPGVLHLRVSDHVQWSYIQQFNAQESNI